ncbi:MAG: His/Gly/Thr/Pro-type tRNA ligase C-terminal domain-containing protein [Lactiplantibacillus plantarum]|nr:His/Gly/Thr/Pro-type tRNA ligase C-terminal domain-containing protein [Lactiplantibacillus plantarum]
MLVVGDQEVANGSVSVRKYGEERTESVAVDMFIGAITQEIKHYSRGASK